MWTVLAVLNWTERRFGDRGSTTPRLDAQVLLAHVLERDRIYLYTHFDQPLGPVELASYRELIQRRLAGEPVAYLVGQREFRSLMLHVDARVLVPRPDTETLVEAALGLLPPAAVGTAPRLVDVGTGSGAVALALKHERPDAEVLAVELSPDAAQVARGNAERLGLAVEVLEGDLLGPVAARAPFALVASNPPYIPTAELALLSPEVKREPRLALDGGADGLGPARRLVAESWALLAPDGALAIEVGAGQAEAVAALFEADGRYRALSVRRDLGGIERVVSARRA